MEKFMSYPAKIQTVMLWLLMGNLPCNLNIGWCWEFVDQLVQNGMSHFLTEVTHHAPGSKEKMKINPLFRKNINKIS